MSNKLTGFPEDFLLVVKNYGAETGAQAELAKTLTDEELIQQFEKTLGDMDSRNSEADFMNSYIELEEYLARNSTRHVNLVNYISLFFLYVVSKGKQSTIMFITRNLVKFKVHLLIGNIRQLIDYVDNIKDTNKAIAIDIAYSLLKDMKIFTRYQRYGERINAEAFRILADVLGGTLVLYKIINDKLLGSKELFELITILLQNPRIEKYSLPKNTGFSPEFLTEQVVLVDGIERDIFKLLEEMPYDVKIKIADYLLNKYEEKIFSSKELKSEYSIWHSMDIKQTYIYHNLRAILTLVFPLQTINGSPTYLDIIREAFISENKPQGEIE